MQAVGPSPSGHGQIVRDDGRFAGHHHGGQDCHEQDLLAFEFQEYKGEGCHGTGHHLAEHDGRGNKKRIQDIPREIVTGIGKCIDIVVKLYRMRKKERLVDLIGIDQ